MTDATVAAALNGDAGATPGAVPAGDQGAVPAAVPGAVQHPEWMNSLPEDSPLRNHADLLRMKDTASLAEGYVNTRAWAQGRVAMPDWTNPEEVKEFGERVRPANAADYKIDLGGSTDTAMADAYRQFAFDTGVPGPHAEATAQFFNRFQSEQLSSLARGNEDGLKALEIEHGPEGYARRVEAVQAMLRNAGLEGTEVANAFQHFTSLGADGQAKPGAQAAMAALFTLAEKTGELAKVDPGEVAMRMGTMTPEAAKAERDRRIGDTSEEGRRWMAEARKPGTPEYKRWNDIAAFMAGGRPRA